MAQIPLCDAARSASARERQRRRYPVKSSRCSHISRLSTTTQGGTHMFGSLTGGDGGLFDEFRRLQEEIDSLFDQWPATMGVRSVVRGTFPPINVAAAPDQFEVYLFAPGLDAKKLELSIQQNLLTV